ncbi:response regulator [bacterium]|nr:response regulator [bacterium]
MAKNLYLLYSSMKARALSMVNAVSFTGLSETPWLRKCAGTGIDLTSTTHRRREDNMAKIALIDDSAFARMRVKELLDSDNDEIVELDNAIDGLELARRNVLDVILLDMVMPGMSGLEALETMQRENLAVPVIVLTADIQEETKRRCIQLGAKAVLNKPPKKDELVKTLHEILG